MFTGIISHLGILKNKKNAIFTFTAEKSFCSRLRKGISIAVNGVCLTVFEKTHASFSVEIMPETVKRTMLRELQTDGLVNLELPATPNTFLSGHIVQGHVDGVGTILEIRKKGNSRILTIGIEKNLMSYIVEKGSISVNGISLTVISIGNGYFTVGIILYTWNHTMLSTIKMNSKVNIEVDILAKYVEKLLKGEKR